MTLHLFNNDISNIYTDITEYGEITRGITLQEYS
jgi:hypothetical protein